MLVKFLSYTASVVGSARHRAILTSCLVLVVAFAGILSIPLMHDNPEVKVASSAQNEDTDTDSSENVWLSEHRLPERDPKETNPGAEDPKPAENNSEQTPSGNSSVAADNDTGQTEPKLSLSQTEIFVEAGTSSGDITARISNTGEEDIFAWSITPESSTQTNDITIVNQEQINGAATFGISANTYTKAGTYKIKVTAKNDDLTLTKTLTVVVE